MFGWIRGRRAQVEAQERVLELEAALEQLYAENTDLRDRVDAAEERAHKFRLDFVEAVRRASRLERRLVQITGREVSPSTLDSAPSVPSAPRTPPRRGFSAAPPGSAADLWRNRSSH